MTDLPLIHNDEQLDTVNESIKLIRKKDGLTFGTDSYLLAAYVSPERSARAIDLGSGTGILPLLLLSRDKVKNATAVEIQEVFCDLIERNAVLNHQTDRLTVCHGDVRSLSLPCEGADIVLSNPPYMKADSGKPNIHDIKYIARHEVMGGISDFCHAASRLLKYGGRFYCVYRPDRMVELICALRAVSLEPKKMTLVQATANTEPSMLLLEAKKGAACSMKLTRPLILNDMGGEMSEDAKQIYGTCSFSDFFKN